jgi:hypothetical protein
MAGYGDEESTIAAVIVVVVVATRIFSPPSNKKCLRDEIIEDDDDDVDDDDDDEDSNNNDRGFISCFTLPGFRGDRLHEDTIMTIPLLQGDRNAKNKKLQCKRSRENEGCLCFCRCKAIMVFGVVDKRTEEQYVVEDLE